MKTLTVKLAAPLQSYGNQANYERRTTGRYPSKSAVIGMIAAALGYHRDDPRIVELNSLQFAVRVDQTTSVLSDFHIVEYDTKKHKRKLTYRDYMQDAVYIVAVGSDDCKMIDRIEYALHHPYFQLYLGRRSNPPAGPLVTKIFTDSNPVEVLQKLDWQAADWFKQKYTLRGRQDVMLELVADANLLPEHKDYTVHDRVRSFAVTDRCYGYRLAATTQVKLPIAKKKINTEHDIMGILESEGD
ncbi:type I-E CRISPR-associated protein Cas5/CasD [Ligilactobacillus saerimneri]|uniref:Type I-E CRISPR-associated protein Cas5/CasD n=1 Tax=Ligilactobacillus saerimneri TaxID=228229 RepID=A0A7H9EKU6_9LACO|nr:type I-E CRISPR-associated protein Cas5/CasD [Ligilactobacillus saerimneri]QLL78304.1 type I-E CRISPR-associated protein Cas5/CasD [Ligilactobacillus saerimneri]